MLSRLLSALTSPGVTTIYGEYAAGKTTLALTAASRACRRSTCLYITTEGTEFIERAVQIGVPLENLEVADIIDVYDYTTVVARLSRRHPYRLIVVDSVNAPIRRAEEPGSAEVYTLLVAFMKRYSAENASSIILTAQVTAGEEDEHPAYWPPLRAYSDRVVRVEKLGASLRRALLTPGGLTACFLLTARGLRGAPCPSGGGG
ncbi:MAG: hypothetical protein GXO09_05425 [Crenarchaeota archaeon]|nr:hypothetical protein [Thermoproteota archaeon]